MQTGLSNHRFEIFAIADVNDYREIIKNTTGLRGLAVTIPHKQAIMPLLNVISAEAAEIGAVNCIKLEDGLSKGFNTDVLGFELSLLPLLKNGISYKALLLGTGGASKAVQYVLKKLGIPFMLVSRTPGPDMLSYKQVDQSVMLEHNLIINTTPLGMMPDIQHCPSIPYQFIHTGHLLYDLIYKPEETLFLTKGKARGAITKNGFEMLILQAEENWRIWNS